MERWAADIALTTFTDLSEMISVRAGNIPDKYQFTGQLFVMDSCPVNWQFDEKFRKQTVDKMRSNQKHDAIIDARKKITIKSRLDRNPHSFCSSSVSSSKLVTCSSTKSTISRVK